ncbi:uncharacterized protein LOC135925826 isoform X2 [Gordionus sp. m RMFG-2023]|uniref:uncharacterized protein LOC135925826 isoform X2 n=1 Tax=Gordionus sp. m RMFG-2023 TaxID=3053472 RepID=UPI0031FD327F
MAQLVIVPQTSNLASITMFSSQPITSFSPQNIFGSSEAETQLDKNSSPSYEEASKKNNSSKLNQFATQNDPLYFYSGESLSPRHKLFNFDNTTTDHNFISNNNSEDRENAKNSITFGSEDKNDKQVSNDWNALNYNNYVPLNHKHEFNANNPDSIWNNDQTISTSISDKFSFNVPMSPTNTLNLFQLFNNDPKSLDLFLNTQNKQQQNYENELSLNPNNDFNDKSYDIFNPLPTFPPYSFSKKHHSLPTPDLNINDSTPSYPRSAKSFDHSYNTGNPSNLGPNDLANLESIRNYFLNNPNSQLDLDQQNSFNPHFNFSENSKWSQGNEVPSPLFSSNQWPTNNSNYHQNEDLSIKSISSKSARIPYTIQNNYKSLNINQASSSLPYHVNFPKQPHHYMQQNQHQQKPTFNNNQGSNNLQPSTSVPYFHGKSSSFVGTKHNFSHGHMTGTHHLNHHQFSNKNPLRAITGNTLTHHNHPTNSLHQHHPHPSHIGGPHPGKRGSHNIFGSYSYQSVDNFLPTHHKQPPVSTNPNLNNINSGINLDKMAAILLASLCSSNNDPACDTEDTSVNALGILLQKFPALKFKLDQLLRGTVGPEGLKSSRTINQSLDSGVDCKKIDYDIEQISPFEKDGKPVSPLTLAAARKDILASTLTSPYQNFAQRDKFCFSPSSGQDDSGIVVDRSVSTEEDVSHSNKQSAEKTNSNENDFETLILRELLNNLNLNSTASNTFKDDDMFDAKNRGVKGSNIDEMNDPNLKVVSSYFNGDTGGCDYSQGHRKSLVSDILIASSNYNPHVPDEPVDLLNLLPSLSSIQHTQQKSTAFHREYATIPIHSPNTLPIGYEYPHLNSNNTDDYGDLQSLNLNQLLMTDPDKLVALMYPHATLNGSANKIATGLSPQVESGLDDGSNEKFSRKVFVGGLPPDIDEEEITNSFRHFGFLLVDWPHKAESKSFFPPKGYAFLLFQDETSVQSLVEACFTENGKNYLYVSSPTIKDKPSN